MVHDPRVTQQLSRLGGLYRDPARVDRDAASLLKSSVGSHLQPIASEMVENDGTTAIALVLQGTIAIHFRANTYQLLTDIYLPAGYPTRPPVAFIRLATNMYLKENHRHVGSDGKVYLPYLHEWKANTHNLVELVVAMSSVFSADPPAFTRAPEPAPAMNTNTTARATPVESSLSLPPPPDFDTVLQNTNTNTTASLQQRETQDQESFRSSIPSWQRDAEAILAAEAAEANQAAATARQAEAEQQAKLQAAADRAAWEQARSQSSKEQVVLKLQQRLQQVSQETSALVQQDWRDQQQLQAEGHPAEAQLMELQTLQRQLQRLLATADEKTVAVQVWLDEAAAAAQQQQESLAAAAADDNNNNQAVSVDEAVQPATAVQRQMMELSAENAAVTDALYFLDRGLYKGHLDCSLHLRQVRRLAKRQFLVRAHLIKIQQGLLNNNHSNGNGSRYSV